MTITHPTLTQGDKQWYTPNEVAERWGCHPETIRTMFREGRFKKAMKTIPGRSGHIRISAKSVLEQERLREGWAS